MNQVIWSPQPKQRLALECTSQELFFGGAAGGGKSDFMLLDFLQQANTYGKYCKGILFRRTNSELEELQERAEQVYKPMGAVYIGKSTKVTNTWKFPNGATLKMRYLESEKDVGRYQGHQYTWIGIDELGNYPTPYCWTYMISRLRSVHGVPCYIRGTANPGGVGHAWLKQRFMDDEKPNTIFYREARDFDGNIKKTSCCFIPSRLEDNQILMRNDPEYQARLLTLPPHLARALRYGDWSIFEGQVFSSFNRDRHVIKPIILEPGEWFKFCAMDWGWSKPYSIGWYAVNSDGRVIRYREMYGCADGEFNVGVKKPAKTLAEEAWNISVTEGVKDMVADPAIWKNEKLEEDSISIAEHFEKIGWRMHKANNDRINGLVMVDQYLKLECNEHHTPLLTVFDTCYGFIRTIPMLTPDPNHPEDVDTKLEDHIYDEVRYALMSDFVKHPSNALRRQNGKWQRENHSADYDPYSQI